MKTCFIQMLVAFAALFLSLPLKAQTSTSTSTPTLTPTPTPTSTPIYTYSFTCINSQDSLPLNSKFLVEAQTNTFVKTDDKGYLSFQSPLPQMSFYMSGFQPFTLNPSPQPQTIYLQHKAIEHEEIIITSFQGISNALKNTGSTLSIKKNTLLNNTASNALEVLNKQTGISLISQGPAITKISIRGLSHNRITIIQDGMKLENQQWGDDHGIDINDLNLEKIEIIKGPSSLLYGSDAMGGVVNFISQPTNIDSNSTNLVISSVSNFNNGYYTSNLSFNTKAKSHTIGFFINEKKAHDYQNQYDAYVLNSRFQENHFGAFFNIEKKWGYMNLAFNQSNKLIGLVQGLRNNQGRFIYYEGDNPITAVDKTSQTYNMTIFPQAHVFHRNASIKSQYTFNQKHLFSLALNWQQNTRNEIENPQNTTLNLNLQTFNYNLIYTFQTLSSKHHFGFIGTSQNNTIGGSHFLIPQYFSQELATVYLNEHHFNHKVFLAFGARTDFRHLTTSPLLDINNQDYFKPLSQNNINWSANIGLAYKMTNHLSFKTNFAKGFRFPHVVELSSNGAHEGSNRFEIGSPNLSPEQNYQTDLSLTFQNQHFFIKTETFFNYIANYIYLRKRQNPDGTDLIIPNQQTNLQVFQYQQHQAFITGIELETDFHPHPIDWLHWGNKFAYLIGRFTQEIDNSKNLPRIMPPTWISEINVNFKNKKNHIFKNVSFKMESIFAFAQNDFFKGYNTETFTPAYWLINMGINFSWLHTPYYTISSFVGVNNLFDQAYQSHLSTLKYAPQNPATLRNGIFEMGRSFVFKVYVPASLPFRFSELMRKKPIPPPFLLRH